MSSAPGSPLRTISTRLPSMASRAAARWSGGKFVNFARPAEEHQTTRRGVEETEEQREILPIALVG